jgi:hypothetical protein
VEEYDGIRCDYNEEEDIQNNEEYADDTCAAPPVPP